MSQALRERAARLQQEIAEVIALELPEPSPADSALTLDLVTDDFAAQIEARLAAADLCDADGLARFGAADCAGLGRLAADMQARLSPDPTPDPTLEALLTQWAEARDGRPLTDGRSGPGAALSRLWQRLRARSDDGQAPEARLCAALLTREEALLAQVRALDRAYEEGLLRYDALTLAIAAGQEQLRRHTARSRRDPAVPLLQARLTRLQACRHGAMDALPPIRQLQEAEKALLHGLARLLADLVVPGGSLNRDPDARRRTLTEITRLDASAARHHRQARAALDHFARTFGTAGRD